MKRLGIDTTGATCSVALCIGEEIIQEVVNTPRQHADKILDMVKGLLDKADLTLSAVDGIAFGRGPGSFTGLRIAASVTQGLAISQDLPVFPVSSLAALAQGVYREKGYDKVYAVFDARMGEVYWGAFEMDNGYMMPVQDEVVCSPSHVVFKEDKTWVGGGQGLSAYAEHLNISALNCVLSERDPLAYDVIELSRKLSSVSPEGAVPMYLRNKVTRS